MVVCDLVGKCYFYLVAGRSLLSNLMFAFFMFENLRSLCKIGLLQIIGLIVSLHSHCRYRFVFVDIA